MKKAKLSLPTSERHTGERGIAPLILNLATTWRQVVNFLPPLLYPLGKNPHNQLIRD
jgi:hypothetical protein